MNQKPKGPFARLYEIQQQKNAESASVRPESVYPDNDVGRNLPALSDDVGRNLPIPENSDKHLSTQKRNTTGRQKNVEYRPANEKQFSMRVNADLLKQILVFCKERGITHRQYYEHLSTHILSNSVYPCADLFPLNMGRNLPHDDKKIFTTHEDIIIRYELYTGRKWNRQDDRVGCTYNNTDRRLIDIALISTIEKKLVGGTARQKIGSFKYFTTELEVLIQDQKQGTLPGGLDDYHQYVVSTWEKRIRKLRDEKWGRSKQ